MTAAGGPTGAELRARVVREFEQRFGAAPTFLARAPGRVNLLGDGTDTNEGFTLAMAIDRSVWIALRPRSDRRVVVYSLDVGERAGFDLSAEMSSALAGGDRKGWIQYVHGVTWALRQAGYPLGRGWDGVAGGDIPFGAGLASSAALELATARAFAVLGGLAWEPIAMARLASIAERDWVGISGGVSDQIVAATARRGHAMLVDCRSLATRAIALPETIAVVVLDTMSRRDSDDSTIRERRQQCAAAADALGVTTLRDLEVERLTAEGTDLDPILRRRARHVVSENARTLAAATALEGNDIETLGQLMDESHVSLRDDFECSRPEIDALVMVARSHDACRGARLTGSDSGGCVVALVDADATDAFIRDVIAGSTAERGVAPTAFVCRASGGASLVAGSG